MQLFLTAAFQERPRDDDCNVLVKRGDKDVWHISRTFRGEGSIRYAHHWAAGKALARGGAWPAFCVRGIRYAIPIALALVVAAPAMAQRGHSHGGGRGGSSHSQSYRGGGNYPGAMGHGSRGYSDGYSGYGYGWFVPSYQSTVINTEPTAHRDQREQRWLERCQPVVTTGADGIDRYVYAAPNCDVQVLN